MTNTKQQSKARMKAERAVKLRAQGLKFDRIAELVNQEFGTNHSADYISKAVIKALRDAPVEGVDDLRRLEALRLDNMQARLTSDFYRPTPQLVEDINENGDTVLVSLSFEREDQTMRTRAKIAETMLKLTERRAKLFGLDAIPADAAPVDVVVQFGESVALKPMTPAVVDVPRDDS